MTSIGVPARLGLLGTRRHERAVGAAPARRGKRRAAEEDHAKARVRGVAGRSRLAVDPREERRAVDPLGLEVAPRLVEVDLARSRRTPGAGSRARRRARRPTTPAVP